MPTIPLSAITRSFPNVTTAMELPPGTLMYRVPIYQPLPLLPLDESSVLECARRTAIIRHIHLDGRWVYQGVWYAGAEDDGTFYYARVRVDNPAAFVLF